MPLTHGRRNQDHCQSDERSHAVLPGRLGQQHGFGCSHKGRLLCSEQPPGVFFRHHKAAHCMPWRNTCHEGQRVSKDQQRLANWEWSSHEG